MQNSSERTYPIIVMLALGLMTAQPSRVFAEDIVFQGWTHQKFGVFGGNNWHQSGRKLSVESDGGVSLLWRPLPENVWQATKASWSWNVGTSVPRLIFRKREGTTEISRFNSFLRRKIWLPERAT